ncbi:hypothetical protein HAP32_05128 (plasmid) [Serratia fonticola]|nr:hypothetical protein HAP32_05128 [Serratia fonticola]
MNGSAPYPLMVPHREGLYVKMPVLLCFYSKTHFSGALIQSRCLKPSLFLHPL